jgi:quinol monooxygenase YgiN
MSFPALLGFAGVLVAAVATGLLAGRAVRQPRPGTILWTAATLALTVALAAQSMGFAGGFSPATFRAVQLFALLLAPLWLAWGLVEVVWPGEAARFGARLAGGALTVVGTVILATDPLTVVAFGKGWPLAGPHYQPPSHYALDAVQAVAVILAAASIGVAGARARTEGPWPGALPGTAVLGLAVFATAGLRFSLPSRSAYPLLSLLAAALVWLGATRLEASAKAERSRITGRSRAAGRDRTAGRDHTAGDDQTGREAMVGWDETGRDRSGAAGGYDRRQAPYPGNGQHAPRPPGDLRASGEPGRWTDPGRRPPGAPRRDWPDAAAPPPGAAEYAPPARPELPAAPPYGRILIFTLLDDRVADFDRLAEQAAEEVRTREPDTLVYVIHLVPNAPMQRIFYEIYRDRAAFDSHENQPYMKRFVADRRACVLATNVIELRLKYAKVAPLPNPQQHSPQPPAPQPPAPQAYSQQAYSQQAYSQQAYNQQAYNQQAYSPQPHTVPRPQNLEPLPPRPDRRAPSGDRRYGGI